MDGMAESNTAEGMVPLLLTGLESSEAVLHSEQTTGRNGGFSSWLLSRIRSALEMGAWLRDTDWQG